MNTTTTSKTTLYDVDFYEWTRRTAELILEGRLNEVDREHLAEEIADMGKRERREVRSRMIVLITHLLKWQSQPQLIKGSSWMATIDEQRRQLALNLMDSPSLAAVAENDLEELYRYARRDAARETGLSAEVFPASCPYTLEQILGEDFFPEGPFSPAPPSRSR